MAQNVTIENDACKIIIGLEGAKIKEFSLKQNGLNPIHNEYTHFVCFDRWGPSEDEGIPQHGNAHTITWQLNQAPTEKSDCIYSEMSGSLPVVKLKMNRKIVLDKTAAVARVVEEITNLNDVDKVFNLVQHPSIGPPFLDETTIVDTKVVRGISQEDVKTSPPDSSQIITWPEAIVDGKARDLRTITATSEYDGGVVSFILNKNEEFGWVTAVNASRGLLLGYLWPVSEYPWLNLWYMSYGNQTVARGLEFGTTGLHQAWSVVLERDSLLGEPIYETVAVNDTICKSYIMFQTEIPNDFKGVESVEYNNNQIRIYEYGSDPDRNIELNLSSDLTGVTEGSNHRIPSKIELNQNYPNPFNSRTNISYYVTEKDHIRMDLYDVSGHHVRTLVNEELPQGHHSMIVDMDGLPGGVYLYRLQIGDHEQVTQKLTYVK